MLTVISPAKKLDFDSPLPAMKPTQPELLEHACKLASIMREKDSFDIANLMKISMKLADLNADRFQQWQEEHTTSNARPALFTFAGDVYQGLDVPSLTEADITFAQTHLRILSGLYGLLRPLDLIQPHRLEMGTRLANPRGADLYAFWRDCLSQAIRAALNDQGDHVLINLASKEYFKAVDSKQLQARVVTPIFREWRRGSYKIVSIHAKRARGLMSRYIIRNRLTEPEAIQEFREAGYAFNPEHSSGDTWVFTRD